MFAIVGASGKVGYATSVALRKAGVPVRAILRDASKAARLSEIGCEVALADLQNPEELARAIGDADVVQVIVPPAPQVEDTAEQMRGAIESLARALEEVLPKRVLAISDYGAHITHDIGHKLLLRSAEHMQGWARAIPAAVASGTLPTFHDPVDMKFPTISAPDLGLIAAELLLRPPSENPVEIVHAEGPHRYSANDVATALSKLLGRTIKLEVVPRSQWKEKFERVMSPTLAELIIKANDAQNKGGLVDVEPGSSEVRYGTTELIDALKPLLPSQ